MTEDELIAFLRNNLSIEVKTESSYSGGLDGGPLYSDHSTVQLVLCGNVISESSL
jgi:hypothetical protein